MPTARPRYIQPPSRARLADFDGTEFGETEMTRAEQAVAKVLEKYPTLLADEVARLRAAWSIAPEKLAEEVVAPIFKTAHDLAGYGQTFGFPLVTILARSLCRLLTMGDLARSQMSAIVNAHIATLHVIIRDSLKGAGGAVAVELAEGLDKAIAKFNLSLGTQRASRLSDEVAALQPQAPSAKAASPQPKPQAVPQAKAASQSKATPQLKAAQQPKAAAQVKIGPATKVAPPAKVPLPAKK